MMKTSTSLHVFLQASYSLSESEYAAAELAGPGWAGRLCGALGALSAALRPSLTTNNWEALFQAVLDKVCGRNMSCVACIACCVVYVAWCVGSL